ncbi:TPA: hypothetical protein DEB29_03485 [Candidatus Wolfebacteria bacterium]|nr:hypothetical protein [Candidatus Wolfebacteria bacterium]
MYEQLVIKIKATLAEVTQVKDVFSVPKTKLTKFPCVFFKPSGFTNTFETQNENMATYRFMMIVMVGTAQTTEAQAFDVILPRTVDAIIAKFNADWNQGTIDGHRVWVKIDSADAWELSQEEDGLVAYAPLNVEIKLLTSA